MSEEVRGGRCSARPRNAWVGFRVRLAQRELEYSMKTDEFEIPPMECRARRSRAVFKISIGFHTPCGRPAVAAADLEGFAHSAAADGKRRPHAHARISIECAMSSQRFQNAHARLWIECAMSSQ